MKVIFKTKMTILFLALLNLIYLGNGKAQCLSGTYIVGAGGNFISLTAAIAALDTDTVCGPVTFMLKPAIYSNDYIIGPVTGSGPSNPITFQPLTNGVSINKSNNVLRKYTIILKGVSNITFRNINFTNSNAVDDRQIIFDSLVDHVNFISCNFSNSQTASDLFSGIYSSNVPFSFLNVDSCSFSSCGAGIQLISDDSIAPGDGIQIHNCAFYRSGVFPLNLRNVKNVSLLNNNFVEDQNADEFPLLHVNHCQDSLIISINKFNTSSVNTQPISGIVIDSSFNSGTGFCLVSNNMITLQVGGQNYFPNAIRINNSPGINLINNSVNYFFPTPATAYLFWSRPVALKILKSNRTLILNNIIRCYNDGFAFDIKASDSLTMDHNLYETTEFKFGYRNDTLVPSLHDWNHYFSFDSHSNLSLLNFIQQDDLHLTPIGMNLLAAGAGLYNSLVTDDFDNDTRNANSPDIGADEFSIDTAVGLNNSGVTGIQMPCINCDTVSQLMVNLRNYGSSTLTSVAFHWSINGTSQPPFNWSGALAPGNSTGYFSIGTVDMHYGPPSTVSVNSTMPNNQADVDPSNDSLAIITDTIRMGGTYTVGGTNPDFATLKDAADSLNIYGICRNATFNIRPGLYTDSVKFIGPVGSISWYQGIAICSETHDSADVIISSNDTLAKYFIRLYASSFIHFDDLTFDARFTMYASQILFSFGCNVIEFNRSQFLGNYTSWGAIGMLAIDGLQLSGVSYFKVTNSHFVNVGISMNGSLSSLYGFPNFATIRNCIFDSAGVRLSTAIGITIKNNIFNVKYNNHNTGYGLYLKSVTDTFDISENIFNCVNSHAIYCQDMNTSSNPGMFSNRNARIYNNIFNRTTDLYSSYGVNATSCSRIDIINNTFVLRGTVINTTIPYCHILMSGQMNNAYNNIFANYTQASGMIAVGSTPCFTACDFNCFYDLGNQFSDTAHFHSWQNSTGYDAHSRLAEPQFVSNNDLHILNDSNLVNRGQTFPFLSIDFEGQLRDSLPDVGADEFGINTTDISIVLSSKLSRWKIYPNPVSGKFFLEPLFEVRQNLLVSIFDMQGKLISEFNFSPGVGTRYEIPMSSMKIKPGLYLVRVMNVDSISDFKISFIGE